MFSQIIGVHEWINIHLPVMIWFYGLVTAYGIFHSIESSSTALNQYFRSETAKWLTPSVIPKLRWPTEEEKRA